MELENDILLLTNNVRIFKNDVKKIFFRKHIFFRNYFQKVMFIFRILKLDHFNDFDIIKIQNDKRCNSHASFVNVFKFEHCSFLLN